MVRETLAVVVHHPQLEVPMSRMIRPRSAVAALAVLFAAACADPSAPGLLPNSDASPVAVGDLTTNATPEFELLKVCKEWIGTTPVDIEVTLSAVGGLVGNETSPVTIPAGQCVVVAIRSNVNAAAFTVTEASPGAGFVTTWDIATTTGFTSSGTGLTADAVTVGSAGTGGPVGATVTFTNELPPPPGNQGCTPGYWKAPQHLDSWVGTGYAPTDLFSDVFGANNDLPANLTLLGALNLGGGGANALARAAVAALLNAASDDVNSFYTEQQVLDMVAAALASNNYEATKNLLDTANNLGCPLN